MNDTDIIQIANNFIILKLKKQKYLKYQSIKIRVREND